MDITFRMPAAEDEAFAPGCLDGYVGRTITVKTTIGQRVHGQLVRYTVAADKRSMEVTVSIPDDAESIFVPAQKAKP